jgi:hypothetical protein
VLKLLKLLLTSLKKEVQKVIDPEEVSVLEEAVPEVAEVEPEVAPVEEVEDPMTRNGLPSLSSEDS